MGQRQKLDLAQLQGIQEFPTLAKVAGMIHSSLERADRSEAAMRSAKDALQEAVAGVSIFHTDKKLSSFPNMSTSTLGSLCGALQMLKISPQPPVAVAPPKSHSTHLS